MQHNDQFGLWLRQRRKVLDLTREDLANQVGCAVVTLKKIENVGQRPSKQMAERLAKALALSPSEQDAFVAFARGVSAIPPAVLSPGTASQVTHHLPSPSTTFVG